MLTVNTVEWFNLSSGLLAVLAWISTCFWYQSLAPYHLTFSPWNHALFCEMVVEFINSPSRMWVYYTVNIALWSMACMHVDSCKIVCTYYKLFYYLLFVHRCQEQLNVTSWKGALCKCGIYFLFVKRMLCPVVSKTTKGSRRIRNIFSYFSDIKLARCNVW